MRRRRQKNPLLMRIIVISVVAHIIALPVLAHYGAFKKIQQEFVQTQMVVMPPPKAEQVKQEVKQKVVRKAAPAKIKGPASTAHAHVAEAKANPFQPRVVAAAPGGAGGGGDDSGTVTQGKGTAGQLPVQPNTGTGTKTENTTPAPNPEKPVAPATPVEPTKPVVRAETKTETKPAPPPQPVVPKEPVFADAVAVNTPQPTIPDDLRSEAIDKTCVAEFVVEPDGSASEVKITQSSGNEELDRLALDTARQWRFKPATKDGQPIESRVRLHIEFQVS